MPTENDGSTLQDTDDGATQEGDDVVMDMAAEGLETAEAGAAALEGARGEVAGATGMAMAGASHITRGLDAVVVADRLSKLSDVVGVAGVVDVAEGAELLATSRDVEALSAVVGLMSLDDLDKGLEIGRIAGELRVAGEVVGTLKMPVLAAMLSDRGERLQTVAVNVLLRAAATRSLSKMTEATGKRLAEMGEQEIDEGALRMVASEMVAERAAELGAAGMIATMVGVDEVSTAGDMMTQARSDADDAIGQVATGAAEVGSAATLAAMANGGEDKTS